MTLDQIVTITGRDLDYLRAMLAPGSDGTRPIEQVRVAIDGGLKVSVDQGMWTLPLGEVKA